MRTPRVTTTVLKATITHHTMFRMDYVSVYANYDGKKAKGSH